MRYNYILFFLLYFFVSTANINAAVLDSTFYGWKVFESEVENFEGKKCYIISHPYKSDTSQIDREKPYLMIIRYQKARKEEVILFSGYEYKNNSKVIVMVDDYFFDFKANKEYAWVKNKGLVAPFIQNLLKSAFLRTRSDSSIGNYGIDLYSLKGLPRAYLRMQEICK